MPACVRTAAAAAERPMAAVTESAVRLTAVMKVKTAVTMTGPVVPATATMIVRRRVMNARNHFVLQILPAIRVISRMELAATTVYSVLIRAYAPTAAAAAEQPMAAVTVSVVRLTAVMRVRTAACTTEPAVSAAVTAIARQRAMNARNHFVLRIERAIRAVKRTGQPAMTDSSV